MLQMDMTADSQIEAIQHAVVRKGRTRVPVEDRTKVFSDNGSS